MRGKPAYMNLEDLKQLINKWILVQFQSGARLFQSTPPRGGRRYSF